MKHLAVQRVKEGVSGTKDSDGPSASGGDGGCKNCVGGSKKGRRVREEG